MRALLSCLLLGISIMAYADDETMTVNAKASELIINLPANPTTGFQWSIVKYDHALLTLSSSTYEKPKTNLVGAGGQMHYVFQLNKGSVAPKSTELKFKYGRSWEPKTATLKTIKVNFVK